ncbi:MAG: hypothetical protein P1P90_00145 [Patescibacteria group bacterium]|nr:hypothetical protein [Patescibacteria group bacterium]
MQKIPLFTFLATILISAGCLEPISSVNIAEPISSLSGINSVAQKQGFGQIPKTPSVPKTKAVVRINTDLPSLQPEVSVLRLPPNGLDTTQFQNLTTSMNMPIGLIGKESKNLDIAFTWTNSDNEVLSYNSNNRRLIYANAQNTPTSKLVSKWPTDEEIETAVNNFMIGRGLNPLSYRNPTLQINWKEWKRKIDSKESCINQNTLAKYNQIQNAKTLIESTPPPDETDNCLEPQFPSRIPITFDLVIDERNIVSANGRSEIGGFLIFNAQNLSVEYGWITFSANPGRSDYPAISAEQMRQNMLNGGLGGAPNGSVDINETFFAFMELEPDTDYDYRYLVPALVGSGTKTLDGATTPYNIVVPLTK